METVFQKTIGKFLTKTKVISQDGEKPTFQKIVGRTFGRLIPLDHISYFFSKEGFHDRVSATTVVKDNENRLSCRT